MLWNQEKKKHKQKREEHPPAKMEMDHAWKLATENNIVIYWSLLKS